MTPANADVPPGSTRPGLSRRLVSRAIAKVLRRQPAGPVDAGRAKALFPFDDNFYLATNPDVAAAGLDAREHFIAHGLGESRDPHPLVDLSFVKAQLGNGATDLDAETLARLLADPGTRPHPLFDRDHYLAENPDVVASGMSPLVHFIEHGAEEGRRPLPGFDPDWYLAQHPEAGTCRYQAFVHFVRNGHAVGHAPGPGATGIVRKEVAHAGGVLDAAEALVASGWAYAPDMPRDGLQVEIVEDDRVVGIGRAGEYRRDLEAQGYRDGHCGFAIPLSRELADGSAHVLRARIAGSGDFLHGEVEFKGDLRDPAAFDLIPREQAMAEAAKAVAGLPADRRTALTESFETARIFLESGQYQAALTALQGIDAIGQAGPLVALSVAEAQLGLQRADLALESARLAIEDPHLAPWAHLAIGNAARALGQWKQAGDAFRQAAAISPGLPEAVMRLDQVEERAATVEARRLLAADDKAAALKLLVPALISHPDSSQLQDLVLKVGLANPPGEGLADPDCIRARRSIALLGAVVDHLQPKDDT